MANEPLKYRDWMNYENSWQLLSSIIEYRNVINIKDVNRYICYLHIHVDGSCNGL